MSDQTPPLPAEKVTSHATRTVEGAAGPAVRRTTARIRTAWSRVPGWARPVLFFAGLWVIWRIAGWVLFDFLGGNRGMGSGSSVGMLVHERLETGWLREGERMLAEVRPDGWMVASVVVYAAAFVWVLHATASWLSRSGIGAGGGEQSAKDEPGPRTLPVPLPEGVPLAKPADKVATDVARVGTWTWRRTAAVTAGVVLLFVVGLTATGIVEVTRSMEGQFMGKSRNWGLYSGRHIIFSVDYLADHLQKDAGLRTGLAEDSEGHHVVFVRNAEKQVVGYLRWRRMPVGRPAEAAPLWELGFGPFRSASDPGLGEWFRTELRNGDPAAVTEWLSREAMSTRSFPGGRHLGEDGGIRR